MSDVQANAVPTADAARRRQPRAAVAAAPDTRAQEFKGQAPPDTPATPEEQELIQLERAWDAAFVAKDIRFIERVLADEFVVTYGDGTRGDKAAELAQTLDFDQRVDSSVLDSFRVRIYGETADRLVQPPHDRTQVRQDRGGHLPVRGRVREARRPLAVRVEPEHPGLGRPSALRVWLS